MSELSLFKKISNNNVKIGDDDSEDLVKAFFSQQDSNHNNNNNNNQNTGLEIDEEVIGEEEEEEDQDQDQFDNDDDDDSSTLTTRSHESVIDDEQDRIQRNFYLNELRSSGAFTGGLDNQTSLAELKYMWEKHQRDQQANSSVSFYMDCGKILFTGLEAGNRWLKSPLRLEGWSTYMQSKEQQERLRPALKRMHVKYFAGSGGGQMDPLLEILWILGSSVLLFHFTQPTVSFTQQQPQQQSQQTHPQQQQQQQKRPTMPKLNL